MKTPRPLLIAVSVVLSGVLAFAARDLAYRMVVLPVAYAGWQLGLLFRAVPQLVWWTALVVMIALVLGWHLVPEVKPALKAGRHSSSTMGEVAVVARWLQNSRHSTYFKWQLAHRLGRISQRLLEIGGQESLSRTPDARVEAYLAAGIKNSFVDFPARRPILRGRKVTALDVDAGEVVEYLESQTRLKRGNHGDSR